MTRAHVSLLPHESKRLIAKGVKKVLEKKEVIGNDKILISLGTTNIYVVEELAGDIIIDKEKFVAGMVTQGVQCINAKDNRLTPILIDESGYARHVEDMFETIKDFGAGDVFIKGANALDSDYNIGIYMANEMGGTISVYPLLEARGVEMITPVGREKLIPSVPHVAGRLGSRKIDYSLGKPCGMICIPTAKVVSEVEAFKLISEIDAYQVAAGGVEGSEGACGFLLEGSDEKIKAVLSLIKGIKESEKSLEVEKIPCKRCDKLCLMNKEI